MTNDKALLELSDAGYTLVRAAVPGNVRQALDDQRARLKEKDAMARQQRALDVRDAQVGKFKPEYEVSMERMTQSFKEVYGAKEWKELDENKRMDMLGMFRGFAAEQLQVLGKQGKDIGANTLNDLTKQFLSHVYDTNNLIMPDSKKDFTQLSAKDVNTVKRGNLYAIGKRHRDFRA